MGTVRKLLVSISLVTLLVLSVKICTVEVIFLPPTRNYMKWNGDTAAHTTFSYHNKSQNHRLHHNYNTDIFLQNFETQNVPLNASCNDRLCTGYLKPVSLRAFRDCTKRNWSKTENGTCRFINGTSRHRVALASFPGSGSTWVRGLLEKVTGICTGSVYCDVSLRRVGFNGEGVASSAVLAVKTHESVKQFKRAIQIVRCPADAMVSEWNRKHGIVRRESKHTAHASLKSYGSNHSWNEFVVEWSRRWGQAALKMAKFQQSRSLLRVFYEDLKTNTTREVMKMMDFLKLQYSKGEVEERLKGGYDKFHRKSSAPNHGEYFTTQQRSFLANMLTRLYNECSKKGYSDTKHYIKKYIMSCI